MALERPRRFTLTYSPIWEKIGETLERIAASGLTLERAKQDLCREISDRRIGIVQHLAPDRRRNLPSQTHKGLLNSARIFPEDIDWASSRPSGSSPAWANSPLISDPRSLLSVTYEVKNIVERTVERIDVDVADVTRVFCNSENKAAKKPATGPLKRKPNGGGAKITVVKQAIMELWPNEKAIGLSLKEKYARIGTLLKERNIPMPSIRTFARALSSLGR